MQRLPPLYAIVDEELARTHGWAPPDLARALMAGGARVIQLRAKAADGRTCHAWADALVEAARPTGTLVIINDRADVARMAGAAGVHVGQDDLSVGAVRRVVGEAALVGLSTHTTAQLDAAATEAVSYVALGPIFGTGSKATGQLPVGLDLVRYAVERWPERPVVAIGGITLERAPAVLAAGAAAVAVISDLLVDERPERRARAYGDRLGA